MSWTFKHIIYRCCLFLIPRKHILLVLQPSAIWRNFLRHFTPLRSLKFQIYEKIYLQKFNADESEESKGENGIFRNCKKNKNLNVYSKNKKLKKLGRYKNFVGKKWRNFGQVTKICSDQKILPTKFLPKRCEKCFMLKTFCHWYIMLLC